MEHDAIARQAEATKGIVMGGPPAAGAGEGSRPGERKSRINPRPTAIDIDDFVPTALMSHEPGAAAAATAAVTGPTAAAGAAGAGRPAPKRPFVEFGGNGARKHTAAVKATIEAEQRDAVAMVEARTDAEFQSNTSMEDVAAMAIDLTSPEPPASGKRPRTSPAPGAAAAAAPAAAAPRGPRTLPASKLEWGASVEATLLEMLPHIDSAIAKHGSLKNVQPYVSLSDIPSAASMQDVVRTPLTHPVVRAHIKTNPFVIITPPLRDTTELQMELNPAACTPSAFRSEYRQPFKCHGGVTGPHPATARPPPPTGAMPAAPIKSYGELQRLFNEEWKAMQQNQTPPLHPLSSYRTQEPGYASNLGSGDLRQGIHPPAIYPKLEEYQPAAAIGLEEAMEMASELSDQVNKENINMTVVQHVSYAMQHSAAVQESRRLDQQKSLERTNQAIPLPSPRRFEGDPSAALLSAFQQRVQRAALAQSGGSSASAAPPHTVVDDIAPAQPFVRSATVFQWTLQSGAGNQQQWQPKDRPSVLALYSDSQPLRFRLLEFNVGDNPAEDAQHEPVHNFRVTEIQGGAIVIRTLAGNVSLYALTCTLRASAPQTHQSRWLTYRCLCVCGGVFVQVLLVSNPNPAGPPTIVRYQFQTDTLCHRFQAAIEAQMNARCTAERLAPLSVTEWRGEDPQFLASVNAREGRPNPALYLGTWNQSRHSLLSKRVHLAIQGTGDGFYFYIKDGVRIFPLHVEQLRLWFAHHSIGPGSQEWVLVNPAHMRYLRFPIKQLLDTEFESKNAPGVEGADVDALTRHRATGGVPLDVAHMAFLSKQFFLPTDLLDVWHIDYVTVHLPPGSLILGAGDMPHQGMAVNDGLVLANATNFCLHEYLAPGEGLDQLLQAFFFLQQFQSQWLGKREALMELATTYGLPDWTFSLAIQDVSPHETCAWVQRLIRECRLPASAAPLELPCKDATNIEWGEHHEPTRRSELVDRVLPDLRQLIHSTRALQAELYGETKYAPLFPPSLSAAAVAADPNLLPLRREGGYCLLSGEDTDPEFLRVNNLKPLVPRGGQNLLCRCNADWDEATMGAEPEVEPLGYRIAPKFGKRAVEYWARPPMAPAAAPAAAAAPAEEEEEEEVTEIPKPPETKEEEQEREIEEAQRLEGFQRGLSGFRRPASSGFEHGKLTGSDRASRVAKVTIIQDAFWVWVNKLHDQFDELANINASVATTAQHDYTHSPLSYESYMRQGRAIMQRHRANLGDAGTELYDLHGGAGEKCSMPGGACQVCEPTSDMLAGAQDKDNSDAENLSQSTTSKKGRTTTQPAQLRSEQGRASAANSPLT